MAEYKGTVELIGGLTPKNNGTFPLASAKDIQVDATGKRLDEKLAELEQGGGTVTVIVDGQAGTASHSSTEIYALVQAGNSVVAVLPDYANYQYQYDGYNEPTAANSMQASVKFIHTAVDENGILTTDYIIIHEDKSADAGYYEGTGTDEVYIGDGSMPEGAVLQLVLEEDEDDSSHLAERVTLGIHSDGLVYIFVDGKPVGDGIEFKAAGDVYGYIDSDNNIVLNGNLGDGTYSVKYEMEDGSTVDIGDLVLDSNTYYSVTKNLTNCVLNNSATQVVAGGSYSATVTANSGYTLDSVSVTMGGSVVSVSGGVVSIESVTGDIVITAVASEVQTSGGNLADPTSEDWLVGARYSVSSQAISTTDTADTVHVTNYIPVKKGDVIHFDSTVYFSNNTYGQFAGDANKNKLLIAKVDNGGSYWSFENNVITILHDDVKFMRFTLINVADKNAVTIKLNETTA